MIKLYTTKDGAELYEFRVYAGSDPLTGKKKYIHRRGFKTFKTASLAESRATVSVADGTNNRPSDKTFEDVFNEWFEGYKGSVRASTLHTRRYDFEAMIVALGTKKFTKITSNMIQRVVNAWAKETSREYSVRLNYLSRIFKYAIREGYIHTNPALNVLPPKYGKEIKNKKEKFWDRNELARFFDAIDSHKAPQPYAYFRTLAFSGIRSGEAAALVWSDIDFERKTLSITKTQAKVEHGKCVVQPTKTKASTRLITLDVETIAALRQWRTRQAEHFLKFGISTSSPTQPVFTTSVNKWLYHDVPTRWLNRYTKAAGIEHKITLHGFRHSHASALLAAGVPIKEVQARLGHTNAQTTLNVYAHVSQGQDAEAINTLSRYLAF